VQPNSSGGRNSESGPSCPPTRRCTVGRLMRQEGLRGVVRGGYQSITTPAKESHTRPDLVEWDFTATPKTSCGWPTLPRCESCQSSSMWRW
jgi:hypothetical protein